tara:strand:+ start:142 stop:528 length:387 start_codon:yes stop_codon:yes gene_type:complete
MYLVYLLKCENKTYIGMTNDFLHRWRQHIGELKGGAKYTSRNGKDWYPICIVDGFQTKQEACQCEWRWKHNKKYRGPSRRIEYLSLLMKNEKWTKNSPLLKEQDIKIYVDEDYKDLLGNIKSEELYWK